MSKKKTGVQRTTPRGIGVYPKLNSPDTKFDPAGKYTSKLKLLASDPEVQAFKEFGEKLRDDFLAKTVESLKAEKKAALAMELKAGEFLKVDRDPETGDETGYFLLNASMRASGTREDGSKWTQQPAIYDAKGKELRNPPIISGGTEMKLSVVLDPFVNNTTKEVQVSVRLLGAQILKLVSGGQRDFSSLGFQAEDGDEIEDRPAFGDETAGGDASDGNDDI